MAAQKILLDTDIGTDIDDAVCLAYLLSHPRCDLLGITTATGEADLRARLASALCLRANKDVPIFPGSRNPLLLPQRQVRAEQAEALSRWDHQTSFPEGEAVRFLQETIRGNPGEIILLTIGPLTNVGLLFATDPEIPALLKGLVMMCGRFLSPIPAGYGPIEWNAVVDAHASAIVYRAPVRLHRSIGLDVTNRVHMSREQFRRTFADVPLFAPVLDWGEIWFRSWKGTTFHDPLAAASIFEPALCRWANGRADVELTPGEEFGLTRWQGGGVDSPHEVAESVDAEGFFRHFVGVTGGEVAP